MRAIASLAGLMIAASLGGCAQSSAVPEIGLGGGADAPEAASGAAPGQGQSVAANPAAVPPIPSRNSKKAKAAPPARTMVAANQPAPAATNSQTQPAAADPGETSSFSLGNLFSGGDFGPDSVTAATSPVNAYSMLAQQIHACWLTPGSPRLPNHGFHAEVAPNNKGDAKIIIYEKAAEANKRGFQAFKITISGSASSSVIASQNYRLDSQMEGVFKADLARWAKGDNRCKG